MATENRERPCRNCTTARYPIRARGLCTRCYRLTLNVEKLERGDLRPLGILSKMRPPESPATQTLRRGFIRQYRDRLKSLRIREKARGEVASGLTIEFMLRDIARRAGARGDPFGNAASWITANFPPVQRRALFTVLHDIEERIRWEPDVLKAMQDQGGQDAPRGRPVTSAPTPAWLRRQLEGLDGVQAR